MNKKHRSNASSLFLMELILAILFFAVSAAVCVQLFVSAHLMSRRSEALSFFVHRSASITELCRRAENAEGALALAQQLYPQGSLSGDELRLYYDDALEPCSLEESSYILCLSVTREDRLYQSLVTVEHERDGLIYSLPAAHNIARRPGHE